MGKQKRLPRHMRAFDEEEIEEFRKRTAAGRYNLLPAEIWWRERSELLEEHGYQLRPRLRPGWEPSWLGTERNPMYCEDSLNLSRRKVIDATRTSDGKAVALMVLRRESIEGHIFRHLVDPERQGGVDRHIVPLLDSFEDDREPNIEFLVMPLLKTCDDPPFETVLEVIDLFKQMLECLAYMHDSGVAHRDCSIGNVMMDAPDVFPNGFHPCAENRDGGGTFEVKIVPRHKTWNPIRYYFIDFGISRIYRPEEPHEVVGDDGPDRDVPEMSDISVYDPFPADVFIMGNAFKKYFLQEYENLDFLVPLVGAMTAKKASERPSAADALKQFLSLVNSQSYFELRQRLIQQGETRSPLARALENIGILIDAALYPVKYVARLPICAFTSVRKAINSRRTRRVKL